VKSPTGELTQSQRTKVERGIFFQEFPPRQKPGSFSVDQAIQTLMKPKSDN
jgi:hypothetical protein